MEFRLFGPVDLVVDGRTVDLGHGKQRCVAATLLWFPGSPVSVDTLIDRVWGPEPPEGARKVLYTYVARLRRILDSAAGGARPGGFLARGAGGYVLEAGYEQVDLARYRRLVRDARRQREAEPRAKLLRTAVGLWRDRPLSGLPGRWAGAAREGLEQQHIGTLTDWATAELGLGRHRDVIDQLLPARAHHPLAEPLVERLMIALARCGRVDGALEVFRRHRAELAEELGLDPSAELRRLEVQILRGEVPASAPWTEPISVPR